MDYDAYFDESGDLGWILDRRFRKGGSSQFFTIAYLIIPNEQNKHINRFVTKFNKERGSEKEYKGSDFSNKRARSMARDISNMLKRHPNIIIGAITAKKSKTPDCIKEENSENILYNYMAKEALCSNLIALKKVNVIPDKRSVPRESFNSYPDLLKTELWFNRSSTVRISYQPEESHNNKRLIFIDWIANFIWRKYEDEVEESFQILSQSIEVKELFF